MKKIVSKIVLASLVTASSSGGTVQLVNTILRNEF